MASAYCNTALSSELKSGEVRYTFASLLIQAGHPLAYIKEQLGHSSIKMTVDVYGHLVPGAHREAMNTLPSLGGFVPGISVANEE